MRAVLFALAVWSGLVATSAAKDITYVAEDNHLLGFNDQGPQSVYFSITTDGHLGLLRQSDIVSFYASSPLFTDGSFDSSDGSIMLTDVFASRKYLAIPNEMDSELALGHPVNGYEENDDILIDYGYGFPQISVGGTFSIDGGNYATDFIDPFEVASAAPEPSIWVLMTTSIGIIGLLLSKSKRRPQISEN